MAKTCETTIMIDPNGSLLTLKRAAWPKKKQKTFTLYSRSLKTHFVELTQLMEQLSKVESLRNTLCWKFFVRSPLWPFMSTYSSGFYLSVIITVFCSWSCRALWEICPVGSLPWCTGTWRAHMCRRSLLKVRVCWRCRSRGEYKHVRYSNTNVQINAECVLRLNVMLLIYLTTCVVSVSLLQIKRCLVISFIMFSEEFKSNYTETCWLLN